jgi:uncharacterized membrane protein YdjX (TVP38/TMEM64 family)
LFGFFGGGLLWALACRVCCAALFILARATPDQDNGGDGQRHYDG